MRAYKFVLATLIQFQGGYMSPTRFHLQSAAETTWTP